MNRIDLETRHMLFLLGVERSGSTWLANIVDSCRDVLLYMEPFTEVADLFRGWPDRLTYLSDAGPFLGDQVRETLAGLPRYKHFGAESPGSPGWLRRANWVGQNLARAVYDRLGAGQNRSRLRFRELNLNRVGNPEVFEFDKVDTPTTVAVKELRLNFKVRMLAELFPEAPACVIIRNPVSQIDSVLRQIERDRLVYLKQFLGGLFESLEGQRRFEVFEPAIDALPDDDLVARAVAYWFINYSTVIEDLRETGGSWQLVRHEELCEAPFAEAETLFDFAGLEYGDQTRDYVRQSSQTPAGSAGPTATTRESASYYRRALDQVDDDVRDRIWRYAGDFWELAPDPVREYHDWLRDRSSPA